MSIDTFRFEERALLARCAALVADGEFTRVLEIADARSDSFWLRETIERQAQWEAIRLAAELGAGGRRCRVWPILACRLMSPHVLSATPRVGTPSIERSGISKRGCRNWKMTLTSGQSSPFDERYDAGVDEAGQWIRRDAATLEVGGRRAAPADFDLRRHRAANPGRVAYFLVDAMRYEMGAELAERLANHGEVTIRPALSVLPSITPDGMAALMPGASSNYTWPRAAEAGGAYR